MTMLVLKLQLQEIVQVNIELSKSTATFTPKRPTSGQKKELGRKQAAEKQPMEDTVMQDQLGWVFE